jgi:dihydropteroate synthase
MIMGIVNVTPDSFSDGGETFDQQDAVKRASAMIADGADIIDIGGESTRPPGKDYGAGSGVVSVDEELRRVIPVIKELHRLHPDITISIDTMKPEVALQAVQAGAGMINDVSAGQYDEGIWKVAADSNASYVLMHGHDPDNRITADEARYEDVAVDVYNFLNERIMMARRAGIEHVIADVGIGFAKGADDNIRLMREHACFRNLGVPLLVGLSRKAFIGRMLGGLPAGERLYGTLAALAIASDNGASILRVHDVRAVHEFLEVYHALRGGCQDEEIAYISGESIR